MKQFTYHFSFFRSRLSYYIMKIDHSINQAVQFDCGGNTGRGYFLGDTKYFWWSIQTVTMLLTSRLQKRNAYYRHVLALETHNICWKFPRTFQEHV